MPDKLPDPTIAKIFSALHFQITNTLSATPLQHFPPSGKWRLPRSTDQNFWSHLWLLCLSYILYPIPWQIQFHPQYISKVCLLTTTCSPPLPTDPTWWLVYFGSFLTGLPALPPTPLGWFSVEHPGLPLKKPLRPASSHLPWNKSQSPYCTIRGPTRQSLEFS